MNRETEIQSAQLQQLISVSRISLITSISLAVILVVIQYKVIAPESLVGWCLFMALVYIFRATTISSKYRQVTSDESVIYSRLFRFRLGVLMAAMAWGSSSILLFPAESPPHQMFLLFVLMGVTAGGVTTFSADRISALVFSLLLVTPIMIRLFAEGGSLSIAMGMAAMLYLGFMTLAIIRTNRQVSENISLRLEAANREEKVRTSEQRYRSLLAHLPVGVLHYDSDFTITYCNNTLAEMLSNNAENLLGLNLKQIKDQSFIPAMEKTLAGEIGYYEGPYQATFSNAGGWIAMTCTPSIDDAGEIIGGIAIVQDFTARREAEETIRNLAFYDPLTGLPNRRLLLDRLQRAMASSARSSRKGALMLIDLDNFKALNDTLGHDMGDLLLQQIAQRLASNVREGDTVARLGGDEFVVMLEDLNEQALDAAEQTEAIGEKLLVALSRPYQLAANEYRSTSSIGVTLINGHQQSKDELLKQADIALYQAKRAGRDSMRFFDHQMQEIVTARAELESELRTAIEKRQFLLHYQIQVSQSGIPVGAEALIRWNHPERGLIYPDQFIRVAEETNLILPIGLWVIHAACSQIKAWQHDTATRQLILSVNVSANQFHQPDFAAQVQAAIKHHGISPGLLKLELTESMLLGNASDIIESINALKKIGIQFSLDDFGTGYSSLQYLKSLPIDQLKIDQSFVHDITTNNNDKTIVRTIIAMAENLGLDVIAEGVETEEQHQLLLKNNCPSFQGYLFGRPVPIDQFQASLDKHHKLPIS